MSYISAYDLAVIVFLSGMIGFILGRFFKSAQEDALHSQIGDLKRHISTLQKWMQDMRNS